MRLGPAVAPPSTETSYLPDDEEAAAPPPRRKGRVLPLLVAVFALGGFAAIVWYAYSWGTGEVPSGELPVVTAEQDLNDAKERPEEPGGMEVPHQDAQVLNDRDGEDASAASDTGQFERLLPPPESPQPPEPIADPVEEAPAAAADAADQQPGTAGDLPSEPPAPPQIGQAPDTAPDSSPDTPSEAQVPSVSIPDAPDPASPAGAPVDTPTADTPVAESPMPDGDQPPPGETVEVSEQPVVPPQADTSSPAATSAPESATATTGQTPAPAPSAPATADQTAATGSSAVRSGDWVLQMAALRDRGAVDAEWSRLQAKHPDLLGNLSLAVQTVAVEGQGDFHRLQAGPLPNRATATDLCGLLQGSGTDCLVKQH
ncbi:SPOR domain-containing protein [Algihabitans sp.]|uniref:SPOR domain-containing protein n=1 Tax=Algihabitans sp. TaxID=2821514 RepID=UPI003BA8F46B